MITLRRTFTKALAISAATFAIMGTATAAQASGSPAASTTVTAAGMTAEHTGAPFDPAVPLPSCGDITYRGSDGYIAVRTSPSGTVAWGIYMYNAALNDGPWWVSIYVDGKRVDYKSPPKQVYAPHGSVNPKYAKKGMKLTIAAKHTATANGTTYVSVTNGCIIP